MPHPARTRCLPTQLAAVPTQLRGRSAANAATTCVGDEGAPNGARVSRASVLGELRTVRGMKSSRPSARSADTPHALRCPLGDACNLVDRRTLACLLGRSVSTINTWVSQGRLDLLPAMYQIGGRAAWRRCEIDAFIDGRRV